jgi:hypothetical protein
MVPGFVERERRAAEMQRRDWLAGAPYEAQFPPAQRHASLWQRNPVIALLRRSLVSTIALGHRLQARQPRPLQPVPEQG